ncbi:hypothetical protein VNO80_33850 [Phaseolus coccineus]
MLATIATGAYWWSKKSGVMSTKRVIKHGQVIRIVSSSNKWVGDPSCLAVKERIGIGFTIGVASRSKSEGISANQSLIQPALESDQSFQQT